MWAGVNWQCCNYRIRPRTQLGLTSCILGLITVFWALSAIFWALSAVFWTISAVFPVFKLKMHMLLFSLKLKKRIVFSFKLKKCWP